jgi:outer membrane protein
MKNLSLVLSSISLAAVIVLFYLHFSPRKASTVSTGDETVTDLKVAYINSDTVLKYYDYFKVAKEKLEAKGKTLNQDLENRAQSLQNDITSYQRNVGSMTIGQAKAVEEDLGKKQQNFRLYQQSLEQELATDQAKMNEELYANVTAFLKKYGQEKGLQMVLKYDPSSDVLYGGSGIDITKDVIKGLNDSYTAGKTDAGKDTTSAKKK